MVPNINILGKEITAYIIMALLGALITGFFACYLTKKENKNVNDTIIILLIAVLGVLIGGHLLYGITNMNELIKLITHFNKLRGFKAFISVLGIIFGGQVFYGGLIGGLIAGSIYISKKKLDKVFYFDLGAVTIPLFHFFARIGCFLSGCCYGIESSIGFKYKHSMIESANGVNRFPIQLVESGYNLLIFILLYILYKKEILKGKLLYLYLILYSVARFIFEFFRGDDYRGFLFGLSTSQIISIVLFVFATVMLIIKQKKISNE